MLIIKPRFHAFFNQLEMLIENSAMHSPVRHGLFCGMRARPIRALQAELAKIKIRCDDGERSGEIIEIASKMGKASDYRAWHANEVLAQCEKKSETN